MELFRTRRPAAPSLLAFMFLTLAAVPASAADYTWNAGSGDWATTTNWTPNGTPGASDNVTIANGGIVSLSSSQAANNVTLSGGSTINGAGDLVVGGLMTWNAGTLSGTGGVTLNGGFLASGAGGRTLNRNLSLDAGTGTFSGIGASIPISSGRTLTNNATIEFTSNSGSAQSIAGPGAFVNNGMVRKTATATSQTNVSAPFTNNGDVEVVTGILALSTATHTTSATGTWDVASGSTVTFATAHTFQAGSSTSGGGDVAFNGGTHSLQGTWSLTGLVTVNTTVNVETDTTFATATLIGTLGGAGNVTVSSLFTWTNGTWQGSGTATLNGGFFISGAGSRQLSRNLFLAGGTGTFSANSAQLAISGGVSLTNNSTIEFASNAGGSQSVSGPGGLVNNGTLRKLASSTAGTIITGPLTNNGDFEVQTGTVSMITSTHTTSATGTWDLASGSTLSFSTAHTFQAGSSIGGAGNITFNGGTHSLNGTWSLTGLTTVNTVVNVEVDTTFTTVNFNGTLGGAGHVTVSGLFTWTTGTWQGSGIATLQGGFLISGSASRQLSRNLFLDGGTGTFTANGAQLSISGGVSLTNESTIEFTGNPLSSQSVSGPGGLVNNGTLRKTATSVAGTTFSGPLTNNGNFEVLAGIVSLLTTTHATSATGAWDLASGSTLNFFTGHTFHPGSSMTGAGNVIFGGGAHSLQGSWSLTGQVTVSTTTGVEVDTTFHALVLNNNALLAGAGNVTGAGLMTWTSGTWAGAGTTTLNAGFLISGSATRTLTRNLSLNGGTGTFTANSASLQISSARTLTNNSTIEFSNDTAGVQAITGPGALVNNGTLRKTTPTTVQTTISAPVTNTGTIESLAVNLAFTGSFTQTGGVTRLNGGSISSLQTMNLQGGLLAGNGTLTATVNSTGGTVGPGLSAGQLNETGNYTQGGSASLAAEIGGLTVATEYDRFAVSGTANLSGTLAITLFGGYEPDIGDAFVVMTFGSRTGDFTSVTGTTIVPGKAFQKSTSATNVTLTVVEVAVCGNGVVQAGEQCDDGNTDPGDCCSAGCQYEATGSVCPDDGSACTEDECNATGTCTHAAGNAGTICRAAVDQCDTDELCDGVSADCPADVTQPDSTPCNDGVFCNGTDTCASGACNTHSGDPCTAGPECQQTCNETADDCLALAGTACTDDGAVCTVDECDGAGACTHVPGNAGVPCRAAAGDCDVEEACDGAASTCPVDTAAADGTACDDGDECNTNDQCTSGVCSGEGVVECPLCQTCDSEGGCLYAPRTDCRVPTEPGKAKLSLKDSADNSKDGLSFKWIKGELVELVDLGAPPVEQAERIVRIDGPAETPIFTAVVPAGGTCSGKPCWKATGDKGFKFSDKLGSSDGITKLDAKIGNAGKSKAGIKGKGVGLSSSVLGFPAPSLTTPVRAQIQTNGGACFEAMFSTPIRNDPGSFKAKAD